ncbi:MAG: heat-inducible transcriptional repressor HrcA [Mycoplasmataceae bacterium]|jgi:heat-inducible transcriptional repressor|nr:heat-inducible transcriptional repressor HrcA [Mycoplasmataceae bacterium]
MIVLTLRQKQLFKTIVDLYISSATPVSSNEIISNHMNNISSATVRNEMVTLEKLGLLEKTYTSSGRIPSNEGFKYYEKYILEPSIDNDIKKKIQKIFNNRDLSIDTVIDQSVEILNESFSLPTIVSKNEMVETLKRFDFIQITGKEALIIIVTNNGNVIKNTINFVNPRQFEDIAICIRVFNDRLIDCPINELKNKIFSIKEVIRNIVHEYEYCIRQVLEKIFDFKTIGYKQQLHGTKYLTSHPEFRDIEKLNQVLSFLEDTNVWKHIAFNQNTTGKTQIIFGEQFGQKGLVIASTTIESKSNKQQLSIIGPTRMDYSKVQGVLEFIKEEMEKYVK